MEAINPLIRRIVVTGPESTGKSTLSSALAIHYNTAWVPEYARQYLETNGHNYTQDDLFSIANGQLAAEDRLLQTMQQVNSITPVFMDTDLQVIRIWSEFSFNSCDNRILKRIAERAYDFYLLCDTDIAWEPDPLREYPDPKIRRRLFHYYQDMLVNQSVPWALISGNEEQRLEKAIAAVNKILAE